MVRILKPQTSRSAVVDSDHRSDTAYLSRSGRFRGQSGGDATLTLVPKLVHPFLVIARRPREAMADIHDDQDLKTYERN